jgi:heat shock protein HslJ
MASLIDLVSSRMTPEVVQKLATLAGISSTDAKRALDVIVPTQFDGLVSMGATEAGAGRLLALLQEHKGTESFAPVLLAGEAMESQAKVGDALQTAVYGSDLSRRIGSLASAIGIPQGAVAALMGMVMPVVVGLLGREVRERGLDVAGLLNMLRGERQPIGPDRPAEPVDRLHRRQEREVSRIVEPPRPVSAAARASLWPWLLLALLGLGALALWYFTRPAVTTPSLVGTRWHWARTLLRDGSERLPANAAAYVLDFQRDGRLAVRADCNTGTGTYTIDGATLALGTLTSMQTVCPGTSLSEVFLQQLQSSGPVHLRDGKLLINLKNDAGTMEFVPAR